MSTYDLTIVAPVYNETGRLEPGLRGILSYLDTTPLVAELIVVDDGSTDGTADRVAELTVGRPDVRLLRLPINKGKGFAVKTGMLAASGQVRLFTDIDLSVPIAEATRFFELCQGETDVVIGTRKVAASNVTVHQPRHREILGEVFRQMTRRLFTPGLSDITCGFKAFSATAAEKLFSESVIDRWSFDVELLFLALRYGMKIGETPVTWQNNPDSKVRLIVDLPRSLVEMTRVGLRWGLGGYTR